MSQSVEISCQLPVHLFDKSDTFAERKEKAFQSRSRLTTDNWLFGSLEEILLNIEKYYKNII
jgi:hypothetical protein